MGAGGLVLRDRLGPQGAQQFQVAVRCPAPVLPAKSEGLERANRPTSIAAALRSNFPPGPSEPPAPPDRYLVM
jgi:hypothetical protein